MLQNECFCVFVYSRLWIRNLENNHLCVTSLHMSQCHFWIDGMTTRHAENLQICVLAVTFIHLQTEPKHLNHKCYLWSSSAASNKKQRMSLTLTSPTGSYHEKAVTTEICVTEWGLLTSSSCWTACCLALAMMPSSSRKRRSMSVRRIRALCCSRRMRSSCFLPCSSAMQGLCCHCWIRWGRIS